MTETKEFPEIKIKPSSTSEINNIVSRVKYGNGKPLGGYSNERRIAPQSYRMEQIPIPDEKFKMLQDSFIQLSERATTPSLADQNRLLKEQLAYNDKITAKLFSSDPKIALEATSDYLSQKTHDGTPPEELEQITSQILETQLHKFKVRPEDRTTILSTLLGSAENKGSLAESLSTPAKSFTETEIADYLTALKAQGLVSHSGDVMWPKWTEEMPAPNALRRSNFQNQGPLNANAPTAEPIPPPTPPPTISS